ncbi:MAG: response regulator transcription factor [Thermotogae bacterium]|nr:response regulator transcription factor [Thermotogota bacterium]HOO75498.1 LytTR family DNA-binding domain-containing protein [Tepiditoga sp.]
MTIKSFIVEDEPHSLSRLKTLLLNFDEIDVIGEAGDGDTAVQKINELKPDLLFLDINIPGKNGLELLQFLSYEPMVIFVTAYEEYAIKAFEENAIDYILKPTTVERLEKSISKVLKNNKKVDENILNILNSIIHKDSYKKRFSIKDDDEILIIPEEDIYYFKAQDKYTFLCTKSREYYYDDSLKNLEETLDPEKFIRIHKSYIVSIDKITKLKKWFLRDFSIELTDENNTVLKVGRSYLPLLKEKLNF